MIHIQIIEKYTEFFSEELVLNYARKTLDYMGKNNHEVSLVIGDDAGIHVLNRDYRHIDAPTDVLSFAYNTVDPETNLHYLGDIVISAEKVIEQAQEAGHSHARELCTLIVHGILHLCGYDHEAQTDEVVMLPLQEKIIEVIFFDES